MYDQQRITTSYEETDPAVPVVRDDRLVYPAVPAVERRTRAVTERTVVARPTGASLVRRLVVLLFGIVQALIVLRIVLLLMQAVRSNEIVRFVLDASQVFVAPFEGMLRTNALSAGGSTLDVAAIVALIGWTIVEALALAIVNLARPEATATE